MEKWLILGPGQGEYMMSLGHCLVPESKEELKKKNKRGRKAHDHVKGTQYQPKRVLKA